MMMHNRALRFACAAALAGYAVCGWTDDKSDYEQRAAARYVSLFQTLDRDGNRSVTREEAKGDLNFSPVFDDMDIDRNHVVTAEELRRYLEKRFGAQALASAEVTKPR